MRFILSFLASILSFSGFSILEEPSYKNEYFIVLKSSPSFKPNTLQQNENDLKALENSIENLGGKILTKYLYAFVGLHIKLDKKNIQALSQKNIKFISKNSVAYPNFLQEVKSWGIDRIDQRDLPLDQIYKTNYNGAYTHSYIIDTGVLESHQEFTGRMGEGFSALKDDSSTTDCNGHGTHVAGSVAGTTSGVAPNSILHPVRVFGCSGGTGWDIIIKAIDWVIEHQEKPAIINMSLGGGANQAIDQAVENAVQSGIVVVVAAGNSNADACSHSPARSPNAITVAASGENDQRSSFSNWGGCVDIFAPGQNIISASHTQDNAYRSLSGTSMASPHVAGAAALVLGIYPTWTTDQVANLLSDSATFDKITNPNQSPNALLYVKELGEIPFVDAGKDVIKRYPQNNVTLIGKARSVTGNITKTTWEQTFGPSISLPNSFDWQNELYLENLPIGEYRFLFRAWDNSGASASDEVSVLITEKNLLPIANAGEDKKITKKQDLYLDGSKSLDKDGSIAAHSWQQISGPTQVVIETPSSPKSKVTNLDFGTYVFELNVEDNEQGATQDQVTITINHPPQITAEDDQSIDLPTNFIELSAVAKDKDSHELRFLWTQEQGPKTANINSPYTLNTKITNLVEGEYIFRVYVSDEINEQASDTVKITVIQPNTPPTVSAGEDVEIILPNNSITLKGECSDEDGWCNRVSWQLKQKLFSPISTNLKTSNLILENLFVGEYHFIFTGTDNLGKSSSDEVVVKVIKQ